LKNTELKTKTNVCVYTITIYNPSLCAIYHTTMEFVEESEERGEYWGMARN